MITILTGENSFALKRALDARVADFIAKHGDFGLERLDGEEVEYDRIREALESLPFLAEKKLVVLRAPSANKQFIEHAERLLAELPESTDLIIVEPKLDKRLAYYKLLKKQPGFTEYTPTDEVSLSRWLSEEAARLGGSLKQADAQYMVERLGSNQQTLANEIDKLVHYNPAVTRQTIELLTEPAPHSTAFQMLDAAFAGSTARALKIYEELRYQGEEPIKIVGLIAWQLHILALIKTAGDRDPAAIAREAKISPYSIRNGSSMARRFTLVELKALIHRVRQLDVALKSTATDPDEALRTLIVTIA